jgi:ATP/maltotriose-dependent transcriptional regulator MalT
LALSSARRVCGFLELRRGDLDAAERDLRAGFDWCEREGCPVELGRCLHGLAEVAERRGEREQAMEYLDRAGELFSRHGAKLYLDQVLAKKEILL